LTTLCKILNNRCGTKSTPSKTSQHKATGGRSPLSIAAERGAISARSGQKQQSATQCSNAERLEKADEAGAIAGKSGRDAGQSGRF